MHGLPTETIVLPKELGLWLMHGLPTETIVYTTKIRAAFVLSYKRLQGCH